jgi:hypothetical protein
MQMYSGKPQNEVLNSKYNFTQDDIARLERDMDKPRLDYNKIETIMDEAAVIQAIVRPDRHKLVAFPSSFNTPGTPIHKFNTVPLVTNANGVCWAEVNFGQYLGKNLYLKRGNGYLGGACDRSNVFVSEPSFVELNGYDEITNPRIAAASDVMKEQIEMYNSVRAGPAAVWYDFTGRIDVSAGTITAGITYSGVDDLGTIPGDKLTEGSGALPDLRYTTQKAIEDCQYKLSCSLMDPFTACFIPHDSSALDIKNPARSNSGVIQRFFILIVGAAPNERVGQLKIAMNFDGKPNPGYADNVSTSICRAPSMPVLKNATDWLIQNGNVIRKSADQGFGVKRFDNKFGK